MCLIASSLECLSQRWEDSWLSPEVIKESKKYEQLAVALLFFMDQIGKRKLENSIKYSASRADHPGSPALLQQSIHVFSTVTWTHALDRRPIRLSQAGLVKFHEMPIGKIQDAVFTFCK
jgi:hypothetical protein